MISAAAARSVLDDILASTRSTVAARRAERPDAELEREAADRAPRASAFAEALTRPGLNVIAECKRRSPSRGVLRPDYDAAAIAASYEAAGAAAISVLTEGSFFGGSLDDLRAVRNAVGLPLLRKDFVTDRYQLLEARAAGADAVLLIVAALRASLLESLLREAGELGLAALVEVHDVAELELALAAGAALVGVNNRDLRTLAVSLDTARSLVDRIPRHVTAVAESGLSSRADLRDLRRAGYDAFLVGEAFMTAQEPGAALESLLRSEAGG